LNFFLLGHIADVITRAKFGDNRFRGFGVLIPPILPFCIGKARRPYNSVSTTVLHCDHGLGCRSAGPFIHSSPDSVGKGMVYLGCPVVPFVCSSGGILLPRYLMNGLIRFDKTDREYSLALTDDLIKFWRSKAKVTAGLSMLWQRHLRWRWRWGVEVHLPVPHSP